MREETLSDARRDRSRPSIGNAAAEAARARASHVLARTPDAARNDGAAAWRPRCARRRTILAANADDLAGGAPASAALARPAGARPEAARSDRRGAGGHRRAARPGRPHAGRMDAAERAAHPAGRVPLGVIGIIYESRPNVAADAGGLALKSGNAAILRGGSESVLIRRGRWWRRWRRAARCRAAGGRDAAGADPRPRRVGMMLAMSGVIDIIVPRGGASLIERVQRESRIPVIAHLEGLCHTYIHAAADPEKARAIVAQRQDAAGDLRRDRDVAGRRARSRSRCCRRSSPICATPAASCAATRRCSRSMPDAAAGERGGLAHRISRRDPGGRGGRRRRRGDRPYRALRLAAHRRDRHRGR